MGAVRRAFEGSPGRLRLAAAVAVLVCLFFALLGGSAFQAWGGALGDARNDAAQQVRVQGIQNSLLQADAAAANGYLSGGTGNDAQQRAAYLAAIASASSAVTAAAAADPADAADLATVDGGLARYAGLIEQARANNRQQLPLGTAYLRQAGDLLRGELVPSLGKVSAANRVRVADAYGAANAATGRLVVAGVVVLAGLVLVQLWLARRTHRILNSALVAGTVGVLVGLVVGALALNGIAKRANDVATTSYTATVALAQARTAAFDAKSQESLGLINRGNSGANEKVYAADVATINQALTAAGSAGLDGTAAGLLAGWTKAHVAIRALDDGGDWVKARDAAIGAGANSSNAAFAPFDDRARADLASQANTVDAGLSASGTLLLVLGWLTLLLGVLAAGAAWFGVSQRLEEYR